VNWYLTFLFRRWWLLFLSSSADNAVWGLQVFCLFIGCCSWCRQFWLFRLMQEQLLLGYCINQTNWLLQLSWIYFSVKSLQLKSVQPHVICNLLLYSALTVLSLHQPAKIAPFRSPGKLFVWGPKHCWFLHIRYIHNDPKYVYMYISLLLPTCVYVIYTFVHILSNHYGLMCTRPLQFSCSFSRVSCRQNVY